jgi:hypothetical protein
VYASSSATLIDTSNERVISRDVGIFPLWISSVCGDTIILALVCVGVNGLGASGLALAEVSLAEPGKALSSVMLLTFESFPLAKRALWCVALFSTRG